jgi:hypothetical protein
VTGARSVDVGLCASRSEEAAVDTALIAGIGANAKLERTQRASAATIVQWATRMVAERLESMVGGINKEGSFMNAIEILPSFPGALCMNRYKGLFIAPSPRFWHFIL